MTSENKSKASPDVFTAGMNQGENLSNNQELQVSQMVRSLKRQESD